jgi:hypothetical protein
MPTKSKDSERSVGRVDSDTAAYEQLQGGHNQPRPPDKRDPKMPHERDESAGSTGNRPGQSPAPSDPQISRAHADVEQGRLDTDRRGVRNDIPRSPHNRER